MHRVYEDGQIHFVPDGSCSGVSPSGVQGNEAEVSTNPETRASGADVAVICAWCPQLHILRMQRRDVDVIVIYQQDKELRIIRNGKNLTISHGICEPCRAKMK